MANENFLGGRLRIFSQLHKEYMKPYTKEQVEIIGKKI